MNVRPLVIANPAAGGGRARDLWRNGAGRVAEFLGPHDLALDRRAGRCRTDRPQRGGRPGTCSSLSAETEPRQKWRAASRSRAGPPNSGLLPCGTGNDFATDLGIPSRLPEAARLLSQTRGRPTDLGRVECGGRPLALFSEQFFPGSRGLGRGADGEGEKRTWAHRIRRRRRPRSHHLRSPGPFASGSTKRPCDPGSCSISRCSIRAASAPGSGWHRRRIRVTAASMRF